MTKGKKSFEEIDESIDKRITDTKASIEKLKAELKKKKEELENLEGEKWKNFILACEERQIGLSDLPLSDLISRIQNLGSKNATKENNASVEIPKLTSSETKGRSRRKKSDEDKIEKSESKAEDNAEGGKSNNIKIEKFQAVINSHTKRNRLRRLTREPKNRM